MKALYIDDIRNPKTDNDWVIVRTSQEAIDYVKENGMPQHCSFDHDLGGDDTSMVFVKWLINEDIEKGNIIPKNFNYWVHSANPIGKGNIDGMLRSYLKFREKKLRIL